MKIKYTVRGESGYKTMQMPINNSDNGQQEVIEEESSKEKKFSKPKMMTIKEVAATGILSEYAIRLLIKEGRLPVLRIGNRALINYERLVEDLNTMCLDKGKI